jgi:hypothetical protein
MVGRTTDRRTTSRTTSTTSTGDERSLEVLGLSPGERVRWQRKPGGHWHEGVVIRREPDGSVAVRDADGAWRSIVIDRLEARQVGRRGSRSWVPVAERATRSAQLTLWS